MDSFDVVIVGSGAAAYSTADWILKMGDWRIAMVTQGKDFGTSRNAGSDKQTYYKMSLTGDDSPRRMAEALGAGGGMHGDTAFIEASGSLRCFMRLVEYGVPFPEDSYGRFVGYQTDHDAACRGTSAGPLTSKYMTECLERRVLPHPNVTLIDNAQVIRIVTRQGRAVGVLYLSQREQGYEILPLKAGYVVLATGGAALTYEDRVYPDNQQGGVGLALRAGCALQNFCEWQYGIASLGVKWNLSGSYQQVIPRYYSVDQSGEEREFLKDLPSPWDLVFLKGYQWPFDSRKIEGSSAVDLAVNRELMAGRRVFMDFRRDPEGFSFDRLGREARDYLEGVDACGNTPIDRLAKLNPQAIEFYRSKGVDLYKQPLEIAVCAQHMNGGVKVNVHWQTEVKALFAVGETAGTFGVYRPGGSALNSTQVGGLRVARRIKAEGRPPEVQDEVLLKAMKQEEAYIQGCLHSSVPRRDFARAMSRYAGFSRVYEEIVPLAREIAEQMDKVYYHAENTFQGVAELYAYLDTLWCQRFLCITILKAMETVGSRGGAVSRKGGQILPERERYRKFAIVTRGRAGREEVDFEPLRPMPDGQSPFERVWRQYNQEMGIPSIGERDIMP